jgi:hypothetical protein
MPHTTAPAGEIDECVQQCRESGVADDQEQGCGVCPAVKSFCWRPSSPGNCQLSPVCVAMCEFLQHGMQQKHL